MAMMSGSSSRRPLIQARKQALNNSGSSSGHGVSFRSVACLWVPGLGPVRWRTICSPAGAALRYCRRCCADQGCRIWRSDRRQSFDSNSIVADLTKRGAKIVISQHSRRAQPLDIDLEAYKWRHLIENFFCKLKEFKRVAMRSDKTDTSSASVIYLGSAVTNSR